MAGPDRQHYSHEFMRERKRAISFISKKEMPMSERMITELFGICLTAIFVGLLVLNAISF